MAPSLRTGYLCVTSWNNKFVKLRFTTLADSNTEAAAQRRSGIHNPSVDVLGRDRGYGFRAHAFGASRNDAVVNSPPPAA